MKCVSPFELFICCSVGDTCFNEDMQNILEGCAFCWDHSIFFFFSGTNNYLSLRILIITFPLFVLHTLFAVIAVRQEIHPQAVQVTYHDTELREIIDLYIDVYIIWNQFWRLYHQNVISQK